MLTWLKILVQQRIDRNVVWLLLLIFFLLFSFQILAFISPFLSIPSLKTNSGHLMEVAKVTSSLSSITLLILLASLGYNSLYDYNQHRRIDIYDSIERQITDWLSATGNVGRGEIVISNDRLRHFQVKANSGALQFDRTDSCKIEVCQYRYCDCVHYELTQYPSELMYGIHFEFEDRVANATVFNRLSTLLDAKDSFPFLEVDKDVPKQPGWIFWIRKIQLSGDFDKDAPLIATHARHFVELVCHTFSRVYSSDAFQTYAEHHGKIERPTSAV